MRALRELHAHGDHSFPLEIFDQRAHAGQQICYLHWHDEIEWIYVAEGVVDVLVDGRLNRVEAGQMFAVDERVLHQTFAVDECRLYVCVFDKQLLAFAFTDYVSWQYINPFIEGATTIAGPISCAGTDIEDAFVTIVRDCAERHPCFQLDVKLNLLKILQILIKGGHLVDRGLSAHELEPIETILSYIEDNYAERITSSRLADLVGYNAQYFSRYFKRNMGFTPTEYVNRYRIDRACEQLLDFDRSILDISVACGFQSVSYFIKKFKEVKGVPPRRYRALLEDNVTNGAAHYSTAGPTF